MPGRPGSTSESVPSYLYPENLPLPALAPGGQPQMLVPPTISTAALSCCFTWTHSETLRMVIIVTIPFQNPWKGQWGWRKPKGGAGNGQGSQCLTTWVSDCKFCWSEGSWGVFEEASKIRCPLLIRILEFRGIKTLKGLLVQFPHWTHEKTEALKGEVIWINVFNQKVAEAERKIWFSKS